MKLGIAALPVVLIIATIVLVAGLGIAGSSFFEAAISGGDAEAKEALYAAEAGANDAVKRLVRDKNCACSFTLSVGNATATVSVSGTNPKTITSIGSRRLKRRKILVAVSLDANDKATVTSWKEITE